ncbi:MAG: DNA gyrase subunit A [Anaerolineae bacterium]|jgi:DNA gyrase subunit A
MELGTIERVDIEQTMRSAYLSYAMSVITSRALPDVRDGLKPVQRRILYAMNDMGLRHDQPTRKSARIVGEVLGKYHPHNDTAVYDAMVRMAQPFAMRYPLVDGQGNFGSVDGDEAAAIRYTEARMTALGEELLSDIAADTVDFVDNFDGSLQEPTVLPAKLPNLLVNGVGGIAVGMATNIPPHNLGEVADAVAFLIDNHQRAEDVMLDELMRFIPGPDFPTGGTILGDEGIRQAYATGRGRIIMRAHVHIEDLSGGRTAIVVTELPYQVNKANLVSRIAALFREGVIDGAGDLRDESDRNGMRIVIELKRGIEWEPVLAALLKRTQMQATFGVNTLALVDGEPRTLSLKRVLLHYIDHRAIVVERRTRYELARAEARAHILEGLLRALDQLDAVIATIRKSRTADTARANLIKEFKFTEVQAQAILDMQLRRLAGLERRRLEEEYQEVKALIKRLQELLGSRERILALVKDELMDLKKRFGDPRRTHIMSEAAGEGLSAADLVPNEEIVVGVSAAGTLLRWSEAAFNARRGGVRTAFPREAVLALLKMTSQQQVVLVTSKGLAAGLPGHQLPDSVQQPGGTPIGDLLRLPADQRLVGALSLDGLEGYLCLATRLGTVKRLALGDLAGLTRDFSEIMGGLGDDEVVGLVCTDGKADLLLASAQGKAIRFAEDAVRAQGLGASGMKGMDLKGNDTVVGIAALTGQTQVVIATERGFGKRSRSAEYTAQGRGGQGAATMDQSKLAVCGALVGVVAANDDDAIALGTDQGVNAQHAVRDVPATARASWGRIVTRTGRNALVELAKSDRVTTLVAVRHGGGQPSGGDGPDAPAPEQPAPSAAPPKRRAAPKKPSSADVEGQSESAAPKAKPRRRTGTTRAEQPAMPAAEPEARPKRRSTCAKPPAPPEGDRAPASAAPKTTSRRRASAGEAEQPVAPAAPPKRRTSRARPPEAEPPAADAKAPPKEQPPTPTRRAPTRRAPQRRSS